MWRLRDRRAFALLRANGTRRRSGPLAVTALLRPDAADPPRVAFAIGRPVGAAVVRNRTRRRLRAAISELAPVSGDYLVSVTPAAADVSYDELRTHLAAALTAVGALP